MKKSLSVNKRLKNVMDRGLMKVHYNGIVKEIWLFL